LDARKISTVRRSQFRPLVYSFDPIYELLKKRGRCGRCATRRLPERPAINRTFEYSRPWFTERTPISVHQVIEILWAISSAMRLSKLQPAELREWWLRRKSSSRSERSFELLADDHANPKQWLESAAFLTTRSDVQWSEGRTTSQEELAIHRSCADVNGKDLRTRQNPSVSELIAKRTATLVASGSDLACSMSVKAALWI